MSLQQRLPVNLLQTGWAQKIDPVISNAIVKGVQLTNIALVSGKDNSIPTTLNRTQQGWFITDNNTNCTVWRTQPFNSTTLTLQCSANTTVSIWVY